MTFPNKLGTWPTVLDLFAGPGGWSEGLAQLGIAERGIDVDSDACDTGQAAGHYRHQGNIAVMNPRDVLGPWGQPAGIVASPPCQGFSKGGHGRGRADSLHVLDELSRVRDLDDLESSLITLDRAMTDDRTLLALEPLRWALALGPRWLAWEQVPAVLPLWDACAVILRAYGYSVSTGKVHAEQYGVPQTRTRAVLVARSAELTATHGPAALPVPTHSRYHPRAPERLDEGVAPWVSMATALGWGMTGRPYPTVSAGTARGGQDPQMLGGSGARATVQEQRDSGAWVHNRPATTVQGDSRIWPPGHKVNADDERRLGVDEAARRYQGRAGTQAMRVTVAEAGVLQSFERDYPWQGRTTSQFQQVGNAVPPLLARAIVQAVAA